MKKPKLWNDPKVVSLTPIAATVLLELANIGQLIRMWTEWTAEGQSLFAWMSVWLALVLWANFYRVLTPEQKWARRSALIGVCMNTLVILTVIWFRYIV